MVHGLPTMMARSVREERMQRYSRENPEIAEEIERQVRAHYGLGEDGPQDAEKDVDKAKDVLTDASDDEV